MAVKLPEKSDAFGWMILPLKRYARFDGRSGRREFWWYSLLLTLQYSAAIALLIGILASDTDDDVGSIFIVVAFIAIFLINFLPGCALTSRRLHDIGLPGWLCIIAIIGVMILSFIGWIGYMIVMSLPPREGENQYGPPVYEDEVAKIFG